MPSLKVNRLRARGLTIIQLMVILLFAGIAATVVVRLLIDKRCASEPQAKICLNRASG
jgi:hypothetical protein